MKQQGRALRYALRVATAVFSAVLLSLLVPSSQCVWLVLTVFLISQTTPGTPLRQAISYFLVIAFALVLAALLDWFGHPLLIVGIICTLVIISAYIAFINRPLANKTLYHLMLFAIVLLIAGLTENNFIIISEQIIGVAWGVLIGIFFNHFFFPISLSKAFGEGVVPVLKALQLFAIDFQKKLEQGEKKINLAIVRTQIEKTLLSQQSGYPEWVFESGFNPGLRSSWRYFLIKLERVSEICFSLNYLASLEINFSALYLPLATALQKNAELMDILICYFENKLLKPTDENYTHDLDTLESVLQQVVPQHIEAIDLAEEYVVITAIVRDVRDMRGLLLQLVVGLA